MRFSLATVFIPVLSAAAADILVQVGAGGELAFNPTNVTAQQGDTVSFQFQGKNHSVTQSTFADPCTIQTTPATGVSSGFQPVASGATSLPQFSITIQNSSAPLWFFCAQTNPVNHCNMGMVFSVNANPDSPKSYAAFLASAMSGNGAASGGAPSSGAPAGSDPSDPSGGAPAGGDPSDPSSGASIAASIGGAATADGASIASEATSIGASIFSGATSAAGGIGPQASSIVGDATGAVGSLFGSPAPTSSAGNSTQTGAGFRLERSASLPVLAAVGLAGVLLL